MKLQTIITCLLLSVLFVNCKSEEEKTIDAFLLHAKNANLEAIKNISTLETKKYLTLIYEPILQLGSAAAKQKLQQMASSIKCTLAYQMSKCSYIDKKGEQRFFNISFVKKYDPSKEDLKLLIDIDKKYFFSEDE
ncbi:MAG: hypothetical protein AAF611_20320 [Bacteroidota bacterium]